MTTSPSDFRSIFQTTDGQYKTIARKMSMLNQMPCFLCNSVRHRHFPIEVTPWSHQSKREITSVTRDKITRYGSSHKEGFELPFYKTGDLCVRLIFVLPHQANLKDCDNLAKGMLDAFEGYIYKNDNQIAHLDLVRIVAKGTNGYVLVSVGDTFLGKHDDVIEPESHAKILWMDEGSFNNRPENRSI